MMKNTFFVVVVVLRAFLVAELFKILLYANQRPYYVALPNKLIENVVSYALKKVWEILVKVCESLGICK